MRKRKSNALILAIVLLIFLPCSLIVSCSFSENVSKKQCGENPESRRFLSDDGLLGTADNACRLCLDGLSASDNSTVLYISHREDSSAPKAFYFSKDGGQNWINETADPMVATNLTTTKFGDLMEVGSSVDPNLEYRNQAFSVSSPQFQRSFDRGKSFSDVKPVLEKTPSPLVGAFVIISTGYKDRRRVYGRAESGKSTNVYVSDDYGDHFRPLRDHIAFVVESRANPSYLYGLGDGGLIRSTDGGVSWESPRGNEVLLKPVYTDSTTHRISTIRFHQSDREFWSQDWLRQIETDPKDPHIVFVVCDKGLYRSTDAGESFRLLPLAIDKFHEIAKIGVDPLNGQNIYAALGISSLYRSSDGGCSWFEMPPPKN